MNRTSLAARLLALAALALASLLTAAPAHADPADIDAAARGVVRVVVMGRDGEEVFPISHGSGFAVNGETIITNAHVVGPAVDDPRLSIGIVPSDGGESVYGRVISVSPRNDLALVTTTSPMRLPPLTIAGNPPGSAGSVTAIGFPMNVDQAQGLGERDIFRAQPPVTSQGFLSGRRPSREFDTVLHTAPIARGNSGGPLVDDCGRVIGVNSFGAESEGTEAEFFFAVTVRELLPFLRANDITPRINSLPCRSLADLDAEERAREAQRQMVAQMQAEAAEEERAQRRADLRRNIEFAVLDERSNGQALALLLAMVALGGAAFAYDSHRRADFRQRAIGGSVALLAITGALVAWLSRPAFAEVEERLEDQLRAEMSDESSGVIAQASTNGTLACTLDLSRSRVLGAPVESVPLEWEEDGCVNERTQYGLDARGWSRAFVPANEEAVSINRFDPETGEYVIDRYLLDRETMTSARSARASFEAPQCGDGQEAARQLGTAQGEIIALLPDAPNERLVYDCGVTLEGPIELDP
ncbi:S1 family peptidase [Alteraurantiacibacter aquimixticola]|uniref:Serine protease n=1 Tax=Alteraurantiacibacter aquimixticola TaxID=2489173 RepID=A0A4T3F9Z2_9SPHN|nr:serine protease [Alteraurantiacibacter aquimixticola]TIX51850.1 serine protease [Alteraurantiacibacter aquimixticola]